MGRGDESLQQTVKAVLAKDALRRMMLAHDGKNDERLVQMLIKEIEVFPPRGHRSVGKQGDRGRQGAPGRLGLPGGLRFHRSGRGCHADSRKTPNGGSGIQGLGHPAILGLAWQPRHHSHPLDEYAGIGRRGIRNFVHRGLPLLSGCGMPVESEEYTSGPVVHS